MNAKDKDKYDFIVNNLDKWPLAVWIIFSIIVFVAEWHYLRIVVLLISAVFAFVFIKERWRRKKEGYYVDWQVESSEDGQVTYVEKGRYIKLYLYLYDKERYSPVVCVPSDKKWEDIMPSWAANRREEIMCRVKKHIKKWRYEENDRPYNFVSQFSKQRQD